MKKLLLVKILMLSLVIALTGCATHSKSLKGKIKNDIFYIDAGKKFKVELPHPPALSDRDAYEWSNTKVKEIKNKSVTGVTFGPAAFDLNYYHIILVDVPMKAEPSLATKGIFKAKLAQRKSDYELMLEKSFPHRGGKAFYSVYESESAYLILSMVTYDTYSYVVDIDILKKSLLFKPSRDELLNRGWGIFNRMFNSFTKLSDPN